jgi:hypothetical protein
MQLQQLAESIRAEVSAFKGRPGRGNPYPETLRCRAVEYYRERRKQGAALPGIAAEIGIKWQSLGRWVSSDAPVGLTKSAGFERLEIVDTLAPATNGRFVVRGPGGLCIEGLDIDALAELIRRLS